MRKLYVTEFYALDGVFEEPGHWPKGYWNDEIAKYKYDELFNCDALLLGRVTYDGFAKAWPDMEKDEAGFTDRMNSIQKYVVSDTLKEATWNNTSIIKDNAVEEIKKLKQADGKDIVIHGSGQLIASLMPHGLIDEYHLLLYPFILGKGKHLFQTDITQEFNLQETKTFSTGVVALYYTPKTT